MRAAANRKPDSSHVAWLGKSSLRRVEEAGFGARTKSAGEGR
ncbi:hypothetical protein [Cohnella yongneupensis]|uniref:Uncharacterized protein n=1 Tax=Cohnella yongneupensis TaxID=425006 RepID=A0ABW0R654_9BACL